jgi:carbamoyltransferase
MIYVGIGDAIHDTSICALIDGKFRYRKSERHLQVKHHEATDIWYKQTLKDWGITKIDTLVYTDKGTTLNGGKIIRKPYGGQSFIDEGNKICLDHHTAHQYSTLIDAEQFAIFDGKGSGGMSGRYSGMVVIGETIKRYKDLSIGKYLQKIGYALGFSGIEADFPGKIMGLQAYGDPYDLDLDDVDKILRQIKVDTKDQSFLNFVASVHKACEKKQLQYFEQFDPNKVIACSGGVMLNTVINTELRKKYKLDILPHVYDGGLSIGCLRYIVGDFDIPNFPYIQDDISPDNPNDKTIELAAEYLAQGKIIGWYQGHGEVGPRALGNRSILMSPFVKNGKDILNQKVKRREWWRPFGASVIQEEAHKYFDIDDSPYMLYNSKVLIEGLDPITHIDGTCRHQTVKGGHFYKLLKRFEEKTGLPVLLNTSLNIGGKPIASNRESAIVSGLDYLFFGNEVCNL